MSGSGYNQYGAGYPVSPVPFGLPDPNSPQFSRRGFTIPTAEEFRKIVSDSRSFQPVGFKRVEVVYPKAADCSALMHPLEPDSGISGTQRRLTDFWQTEYTPNGAANCVAFCRTFYRPDGFTDSNGWNSYSGLTELAYMMNVCSLVKFDTPLAPTAWPNSDPNAIPLDFGRPLFSGSNPWGRFKNPLLTIRGVPFERLYIAYPAVEELSNYAPTWFDLSLGTWSGYAPKAEEIRYAVLVASWYDPTVISMEIR